MNNKLKIEDFDTVISNLLKGEDHDLLIFTTPELKVKVSDMVESWGKEGFESNLPFIKNDAPTVAERCNIIGFKRGTHNFFVGDWDGLEILSKELHDI